MKKFMKKTAFITALSATLLLAGCTGDPAVTAETTAPTAENTTMAETTTTTPAPSTETPVSDTEITTPDFTASVKENDYSAKALTKEEFAEYKGKFIGAACAECTVIAITEDKNIITWGDNYYGKIGNGEIGCIDENESRTATPFLLDFSEDIEDVACNDVMTYALTTTGKMYAWGFNAFCESGIENNNLSKPILIDTGFKIEKILPAGRASTLFLSTDKKVHISGVDIFEYETYSDFNANVALEHNPDISDKITAIAETSAGYREIELMSACRDICSGTMYHAFLAENGDVYIKGTVLNDMLDKSSDFRLDELTKIDFPEKITDIEGSPSFVAALSESGKIYLYGNKESVFFDEKTDSEISDKIFRKGNAENFVFINCNSNTLIAIDSDGYAWGLGVDGAGVIDGKNNDNDFSSYEIISEFRKMNYSDVKNAKTDGLNTVVTLNNGQLFIQGSNAANQITYLNFDTMPDEE